MTAKDHSSYKEELERLEYTKEYIKKTLGATEEYKKFYKDNIKDAMINLDYLDSSQSYINILINTKFMEMAERNFDSLTRAKDKPYFARIDFKSKESNEIDKIYIGKTSLFRAEDDIPLIVDWRAPIANVYYEGRLGETTYKTEKSTESGELLLKRQYSINNGELETILDVDITATDTFLQASLAANADSRLKDIASTIQGEQNRVIRAEMDRPLIVQGVAGSGKTTIALHRIAYFIYTYEKTFDPENFMIMAPNNLFINYISEVLPELGVEKVVQTTFIDFTKELIGPPFKIINTSDKLMKLINRKCDSNKELDLLQWATAYKGSMDMKELIDNYVKDIEMAFVPEEDFCLFDLLIVSNERIKSMFLTELNYLPLYKRINEIKKTLTNQLKYRKADILKNLQEKYDNEIYRLRRKMEASEERRLKLVALMEERDKSLEDTKKEFKTVIKKYLSKFPSLKLIDYYMDLMTNKEKIKRYSNNNLTDEQCHYLTQVNSGLLLKNNIELEDISSVVYMKHLIFGFTKKIDVKNIVIDEAQDFSLFQFYVLKQILHTNMFTLLGDLSQGIHSYRSIQNWEEVLEKVFDKNKSNYMTLVQSYRTTIEVMNLANEVIKKLKNDKIVLAKPVIRHGNKPQVKEFLNTEELISSLENRIEEMVSEGYKSVALICKTMEDCNRVKERLDKNNRLKAKLLDGKDDNYSAGIMLVPSYIAKGLEFDVVFIVNLEEKYEELELDIKLLYVAMTRTLHQLFVFTMEDTIPMLKDISEDLYE